MKNNRLSFTDLNFIALKVLWLLCLSPVSLFRVEANRCERLRFERGMLSEGA